MEKFFSTFDVARLCHVSPGSVIRWIREGKLTAAQTAGGHHRVNGADLSKLLEQLRMPVPPELIRRQGAKALIVDDEKGVRDFIFKIFKENFKNVCVEEAAEGFLAGWKIRGMRPDLVILDLFLPGLDGFRVCEFIRGFPDLKHTKILAMSAVRGPDVRERVLNLGADDFISKPFDLKTMKEKISAHLGAANVRFAAECRSHWAPAGAGAKARGPQ